MKTTRTQQAESRQGFSLVELTVAMFVISIGLLGLFTLFPSAMRAGQHAQEDTVSTMFADMAFATLRSAAQAADDTEWGGFRHRNYTLSTEGWEDISYSGGGNGIFDTDGEYVTITFTSRPSGTSRYD